MMTTIFVFESAAGLMPLMTDDGDDHLFENSPFKTSPRSYILWVTCLTLNLQSLLTILLLSSMSSAVCWFIHPYV